MALGIIPPWLDITPETFLGAAKAGAQIGTQRRAQDLEAGQAADRLRLAYDSLASQERRASESEQMKLELAKNAQALRQSQMDMVNQYKQQQLDQQMQLGQARLGQQSEALQLRQQQGQQMADLREKGLTEKQQQIDRGPASIQLADEILSTESKADELEQQGNKVAADQLRKRSTLLREQMKGQEIVTETLPGGGTRTTIGKGVSGGATTAAKTQAEENLVKYENSMELLNRLDKGLKPEHVGVRGAAGEMIFDRGLQQIAEAMGGKDVANQDRMDSRKLLTLLRESLMRQMSNDPGRFSLADREEVSKALPSSGVLESYKDAKRALALVRDTLQSKSRNYAKEIGQSPPLWTLSSDEILGLYSQGKLKRDEAFSALQRFH